jgi:hypothetical protein
MVHEIDDTDIKILEEVKPFNNTATSDDYIHSRIEPTIELDELHDRLNILESNYGFVKNTISDRSSWNIWSTPQGRQFLRDRPATHKK